jgi:hypothetical protein
MYNLNYNVTNARLNRPVGRPFIPTPRLDPFSSSLVVAIPGAIFKNGYVNVFNQVAAYDDISAYIVSGSVIDETTGAYFPLATNQTVILTGSYGSYSASVDVNNFASEDYRSSLFFTGSVSCLIPAYDGNGSGVNLTSSKAFTIESWVAYPVTASFTTASGTDTEPPKVLNPSTNRILAQKYTETLIESSSYLYVVGWTGNTAPESQPPGFTLVTGSSIFYMDGKGGLGLPVEIDYVPASSSFAAPYEWRHFAMSYTPQNASGSISGSGAPVVRQYINGKLIAEQAAPISMYFVSDVPTQLFGENNPFIDPFTPDSASQVPGAFFQDFRMYNGTNKNYTGSQFTPPDSMIIGVKQPYPQYNP